MSENITRTDPQSQVSNIFTDLTRGNGSAKCLKLFLYGNCTVLMRWIILKLSKHWHISVQNPLKKKKEKISQCSASISDIISLPNAITPIPPFQQNQETEGCIDIQTDQANVFEKDRCSLSSISINCKIDEWTVTRYYMLDNASMNIILDKQFFRIMNPCSSFNKLWKRTIFLVIEKDD